MQEKAEVQSNVVFVDDFGNCVIRNTKSVGITWRKCQFKKKILVERADIVTWKSSTRVLGYWTVDVLHTQDTDRQQLNILQMLARRRSHGHPYSLKLGKQAYTAACGWNWWISSSMHISFTRLDLKQETTMD